MVQMSDVQEIRRRWKEAGSPSCAHPQIDKEYYLGAQTGDVVCLKCGETLTDDEVKALRKTWREREEGSST